MIEKNLEKHDAALFIKGMFNSPLVSAYRCEFGFFHFEFGSPFRAKPNSGLNKHREWHLWVYGAQIAVVEDQMAIPPNFAEFSLDADVVNHLVGQNFIRYRSPESIIQDSFQFSNGWSLLLDASDTGFNISNIDESWILFYRDTQSLTRTRNGEFVFEEE